MKNNPNHTLMLGGDFNLGDIEWDDESVSSTSQKSTACEKLMQILRDHHLSQMKREPTREAKILDLFCTNKRSLVKAITTVPGTGISDHDAIVADYNIKPAFIKRSPGKFSSSPKPTGPS